MNTSMNKNQRGFTLLEMALALSVASMGLLAIADYSQKHVEEMKIQVSGDYMTNIGKAAKAYIDDNYNTIVGIASPTTPFELDVSTLIAANYLPAGYSSTDPFGQQIKVLVLEPQANKLNGLVISTGGEQLNDVSLSQYVTQIGADGGGVYSETPTVITGARGLWEMPPGAFENATDLGNTYTISQGHAAIALWYEDNQSTSGFLYRDQIPSHPELNRMNANIDMANNDIDNANVVNATAVNTASLNVSDTISATAFIDSNNAGFYVDPHGASIINRLSASHLHASRDGAVACCGDEGSLSLAENTGSTGKTASISFHNGGVHEGNMELAASGPRRIRFYDNQGAGMGVETTASLRAPSMVDTDDPAYIIDPSGGSIMNQVQANAFYDLNDGAYYVDPNGISRMNDIRPNIIFDGNDPNYYVDPSGGSIMNQVQANAFYDLNDGAYYVDPNGTSQMNGVHLDHLVIKGTSISGTSCATGTTGTLVFDGAGKLMYCDLNKIWQYVGTPPTMLRSSTVSATRNSVADLDLGAHKLCALSGVDSTVGSSLTGSCEVIPAVGPAPGGATITGNFATNYLPRWKLRAINANVSVSGTVQTCRAVCY